jgi:autotransporter-associated beta strand protein
MATQPAFNAGTNTITSPLALTSNVTVLAAAGSHLTISGGISGTGQLGVDGPGTVVLSGANRYTGGTEVMAGRLVVDNSLAIAAGTSLTVGAGAAALFSPLVPIAYAPAVAASTSQVVVASASLVVPSPVDSNSSAAPAASTAGVGVAVNNLGPRPVIAKWQPRQSAPTVLMHAPAADRVVGSSTVRRIDVDPAWLANAAGTSDRSDEDRRKEAAALALETVFAQYGR